MQAAKTVKARKRDAGHRRPGAAPASRRAKAQVLNQESIVRAALRLIDRDGLDSLSFRRLGDALGCEAMSLYHYFASKAHLLDAVIDAVFGGLQVARQGDWVERLRASAWNYREMALEHPKLFPLLAVHRMNTPVGVRKVDQLVGLLRDSGLDDETAARFFRHVGYYLNGAILDETAGYAKGPSAAEPVSDAEVARDCPNLAAVARYFKPDHFERTFKQGLELLLEGMVRLKASGGR